MIKLKEGQKVLDEDGNIYLIEKGDSLQEGSLQTKLFKKYMDAMNDDIEYDLGRSDNATKVLGESVAYDIVNSLNSVHNPRLFILTLAERLIKYTK